MANERTTFVFCLEWVEYFEDFDSEGRLHFFDAIVAYAQNGEKPSNLSTAEMGIFKAIMKDIDRNNAKFEEIKQKRSEAGKRGNAKRWGKSQSIAKIANATDAIKESQSIANIAEYEYVNEYEYENENVTHNNNVCVNNSTHTHEETSNLEIEAREFIQFFNSQMKGTSIPQARVSESRVLRTGKILRAIGKEEMKEAIKKAATSILAQGNYGTGYDWFCDEDNIIKVIEGTYDNARKANTGTGIYSQEARHLGQLSQLAEGDPEYYAILEATYKNRK